MTAAIMMALTAINLLSFALMGIDKARARAGRWRIRERTLLLVAACFGALGGTVGMYLFRHKTRHGRFRYGLPVMALVQAALLVWLMKIGG